MRLASRLVLTFLAALGLFLTLTATPLTAQTTYTWNQTGTASYATATNWTPTRTTPATNDILVFNNGATTTVTGVPTQTIGQLSVSINTNVTLQSAGAVTLTINGGTGTDLQVDAGSQLNFTGTANAITMALAAGATGSIGGSMTLSGTASVAHRLTAASASGITFQSGSTFTEGTNFNGNPFGATSLNSIVFASGSTFVFLAGANPFGAAQPSSVVVFQTGSLYRHQSTNAPSFSGRTYANYEQNIASTITPTGGSAVVMDNLTVLLGTLNFNMTGTPGHSIRGDVSVAAGATLSFSPASAGTVNLNGPAAQSITSTGTLTFGANSTINVNNANGISLGSNVTFTAGTLQLTSGNISTGANTLTIGSGAAVSRTSGHVIGNLRKDFAANGSKVFEVGTANGYSPFTANVTSGTPGNITCQAVQGAQPNMNAATSIARYWILGASAGITADLTFQYLAGDVMGNEAVYKVFRVSGGVPTSFPGSVVNGGTHTATLAGVSSFSDWTVGEDTGVALPNLTIDDVSLSEGNASTTTFTFTVSLSAPAGLGGVTFDIATADGPVGPTGATAPSDYTAKSLTGQTIPSGSSTYTFDVLVNGDTTPEQDEIFFVNVTNITNANGSDTQGQGTIVNDDLFKIHDVQGNGAATPIPGATVTVEGVVTANFQGTDKLRGFFLQEEDADADADPATSEGIFVFCGSTCPTPVAEGQRVKVTGSVSEFNNMTELTATTAPSVVVTDAANHLAEVTPAPVDLPVVGVVNDFYETLEGMLVTFVDTLTVSEYFELARYGQVVLYEGGRPRQFTEASPPSVAGNNAHLDNLSRREVILDDDDNGQESFLSLPDGSQFVFHPRANGGFSVGTQGTDFFRGGDLVNGLTGVLHWDFPGFGGQTWRIRPTNANPVAFTVANPRPATPPAVGGAIKVVGMNLLNYFTTIDTTASTSTGPCAPSGTLDCRGADSVAELNRQRERASVVVCGLNADVFGFAELENTTPSATITDLLGAINARCGGAHPYDFVNTGGTLGTDAIRVQLIYRTGIVSPVGSPLSDLDPVHNRPPTAQTFDVVDAANPAFGERFTAVISHFKSKGCPGTGGDADAGDGQGCFNATRVAQANRLLTWINSTVLPAAGDPDVLLLGDFNSYAQEDPVTTIEAGGYSDLETVFHGANAYSYLFDGQLGHLDYGFASSSLLSQVTGADAWHINADEAALFDYNDEVFDSPGEASFDEKPDGSALVPPRVVFQPMSPYRASDHDPVLVGLFQIADVSITKTDGVTMTTAVPGGSVTYTITASNAGPDPVTGGTVTDTFPAILTCTWTCVGAGGGTCTAAGSGSISDTVNLPVGGSVTYMASCTISASATGTLSNTAMVSGGAAGDPDSDNNSATDTDTLTPQADLAITKTDGVTTVDPGGSLTYTIMASNLGPSDAPGGTIVADTFPAELTCTWTCAGSGPGSNCNASGSGNISEAVQFPAGGSVTFTVSCTVSPAASGTISNTAMISMMGGGPTDPDPDNNSATDSDAVSTAGDYFTVTPCRVVDTRTGSPLQDGVPQTYALHGVCGIPATAKTVVLNVTATEPTGDGDLTIYASDATPPGFSTLPFPADRTRALIVVVALSDDAAGEVTVLPSVAGSGTVHVVLDVMGYFE